MSQSSLQLVEGQSMDKTKALDAALSQIERAFGKGSIMRLGKNEKAGRDRDYPDRLARASTSRSASAACRAAASSRSTGRNRSGKTTLALHTVAEAQKKGGVCGFIDAEHALDPVYARKLGVNLEDLLISQPDTGEQALEISDTLVRSGAIDVLVIELGRRAGAAGRNRRRDGRRAAGPAGPADEPGAAQADRLDLPLELHGHLHQPDPHEDRRHVRLAGDDHRRQRAEVLCLRPPRHPPHRRDQGPRGGRRQPRPA